MTSSGNIPIRIPEGYPCHDQEPWTLIEWLIAPGVKKGEPIAWIGSLAATRSLASPVSGRISEQWVEEGSPVETGQVIALIEPH